MDKIDLGTCRNLFSGYTELRAQENRSSRITLVNGDVVGNTQSAGSGVGARVYAGGSWGFASHPEITDASIKSVIEAAGTNAAFLAGRNKNEGLVLPETAVETDNDFSTDKPRLGQGDRMAFLKELDDHLVKTYPDLSSRTLVLTCLDMEKNMITAGGSRCYSNVPRAIIYLVMTTEKKGEPVELMDIYGGLGEFEDLFGKPSDLYGRIEEQYKHLIDKRDGVFAAAGPAECILDAELAGILAHEAIGHTVEADTVLGGSVATDFFGKRVGSDLVTLVDYANTAQGNTCPVPVYCDDEGTEAVDAVLIKNGMLQGYMNNKEAAVKLNMAPTGNARAYQFSDEPLIRMRNTAIDPGESSLDEMIASVKNGYYLSRPSNGQADTTSEFMFGVTLGYEIKNGKLGKAIKDTTISGVAFDMLKTVSMVSRDVVWSNSGMCGKKQSIPVGLGGPAIKCTVNIGGK